MIKINGKEANEACSMTVSEYLEANNYNPKHIVVELNEQILPKSEYFTTTIADGDVMEVLSFMGGGWSIYSLRSLICILQIPFAYQKHNMHVTNKATVHSTILHAITISKRSSIWVKI